MQTDSLVLALGSPGRKFCVHTKTYMQMHAHAHVAVPRPQAGHFFPRCAFHERQGVEGTVFRGIRGRAGGGGARGRALELRGCCCGGGAGHVWTCATWPRAFGFAFWRLSCGGAYSIKRTARRGAYAARRPRRPGYARAPSPVDPAAHPALPGPRAGARDRSPETFFYTSTTRHPSYIYIPP